MSKEEIIILMNDITKEALDIDDSVDSEVSLVKAYDAESLDIIDLLFKTGKKVGVPLSMKEVRESLRGELSEDEFIDEDGFISKKGLNHLDIIFGNSTLRDFTDKIKTKDLVSLLNIEYISELFSKKLKDQK